MFKKRKNNNVHIWTLSSGNKVASNIINGESPTFLYEVVLFSKWEVEMVTGR